MRKLYLLRGAPGSGKSSFISRHRLQPYAISQDEIRLLFSDITYSYDEKTKSIHHVITQEFNDQVSDLVHQFVEGKMQRGETVIVDATHVFPGAISQYKELVDKYRYETFVVDLMGKNTLKGLLERNEVRMKYHWVNPDVIEMMYNAYLENPIPDWTIGITPETIDQTLLQRERNLGNFKNVYLIPDDVGEDDFPSVHISNFYFSFNNRFTEKFGSYRNVINIGKTPEELTEQFYLPFFVFKFHHKHFLVSAKYLRNEIVGPIKKDRGQWSYSTGLVNILDFMKDFPPNEKPSVHQFNLEKIDRSRVMKIW